MDSKKEAPERWSIHGNLVTREVGGQVFILMPDSTMHILENESALFLFQALRRGSEVGMTVPELSEALVGSFQVSLDQAVQDVSAFLRDLNALEILSLKR